MAHLSARSAAASLLAALFLVGAVASPTPAAAATATVRITDRLEPATITIAPGTTVVWRNDSGNRHRMRSVDHSGDRDWDTGDIEPGGRASITFGTEGTFRYVDERDDDNGAFHGTVVVRAAGGGAETTREPAGGGSPAGGGGGSTATPTAATVSMAGRAFSPGTVTIAAGGTVTFRNDDDDEHTATAPDAGWDSGVLVAGSSFRQRFRAAGTFGYLCLIHPDMRGTVRVTGSSGGADPAPRGPAVPDQPATPSPQPTPSASTSASTSPSRVAGAPAGTVDVAMVDLAFEPGRVEVAPGSTIRWTNRGQAPHTATADGGAFDSGFVSSGATFSTTLDTPGTFSYVCQLHPGMGGSIVVAAGAGAASPTGTGEDPPAAATQPSSSPSASPSASAPGATTAPLGIARDDGGAGSGGAGSTAAAPTTDVGPASSSFDLGRVGLVVLLVGSAMALFGKIVRSTIRPA